MIDLNNKYIYAEKSEVAYGKQVYVIINRSSRTNIAQIGWYPRWKCYVMFPAEGTIFNDECLESILAFMKSLR
jgi:hypothetical protein